MQFHLWAIEVLERSGFLYFLRSFTLEDLRSTAQKCDSFANIFPGMKSVRLSKKNHSHSSRILFDIRYFRNARNP